MPPPALEAAVAWAVEHRPEVIALKARIAEAEAAADLAKTERRPTLAVVGTLSAQTPAAFEPSTEARVGLQVRWPFSRQDDQPARRAHEASTGAGEAELALEELL